MPCARTNPRSEAFFGMLRYSPMKSKTSAIGIDFGGTSMKLGLVSSSGQVLERDSFATGKNVSRAQILDGITRSVEKLCQKARERSLSVCGVGVGAPGPIDVERGRVYFFPNVPGWRNFPLKNVLQKRLGLPVEVDNDANAMALGEYRFGGGKGSRLFIGLTLGTGIGGGMVMGGRLFHGPAFSAAEFGHVVIDPSGPLCACGNRGCAETFVGNGYFVAEARRRLKGRKSILHRWMAEGQELTPLLVQLAGWKGDRLAREIWASVAERLAVLLAGLINVLNPDCIALGGGLAQSRHLLFGPLRRAIRKKAFPIAARSVRVMPAVLGTDAGLVGAACLAFDAGRS